MPRTSPSIERYVREEISLLKAAGWRVFNSTGDTLLWLPPGSPKNRRSYYTHEAAVAKYRDANVQDIQKEVLNQHGFKHSSDFQSSREG